MFISNGHLAYDPWIWLKVTSLSSTTSVLKDGRISLEISSFYSKFFFSKQQNKLILAINLLISKPWVVLKNSAVSMTSTDMITSVASMTSTASLASKIKNCMHFTYWVISLTSGTSAASMTSTASFHQKTYWAWYFHPSWHQNDLYWCLNVGWIIKNPLFLLIFGNLSVGGCGGHGF